MELIVYRDPNSRLSCSGLSPRPYTDLTRLRLALDRGILNSTLSYHLTNPELWALYGPIAMAQTHGRAVHQITVVDVDPVVRLELPPEWRARVEVRRTKELVEV
jgi:hypothetical protein